MRNLRLALVALAGLVASPAVAQVSAVLPVTCNPNSPGQCVSATPVVNPDGTNVGGGSGSYTGPSAAQLPASLGPKTGASSLSVVPNTDTTFPTVSRGTATLATGQVSVATTSTLVVAARTGRGKVTLAVGAANTCAFGNTGVTTTTGFPLQPTAGASLTLDTSAAIYAACSATTTVSYVEQF